MFKINLVPEVQKERLQAKKVNYISTATSVSIIAVTAISLILISGFNEIKKAQIRTTDKKIASAEEEVGKYKELEDTVLSLERGLADAKKALDGNNRWTKLLPHLEAATPADVQFKDMKLSVGALEGNLKTQNIDGLAKTIDSLKKYQVVSIIGNGDNQGETITISIDGNQVGTAVVKSDGTWIFASNFDPASDHEIKATKGENTRTLKYTASDKKLTTDSSLRAEVKSLFSNVETTHYTREGDIINFDLKANFDEKALW